MNWDAMNWDAIGATAEALGAIGVIITLAYLAVQVRQNSRLLEKSTEATQVTADDAVVENFNSWREMMITNPEVSEIFIRGMEDPSSLAPGERHRFNHALGTFTWTAWQLWRVQALLGTPNTLLLRHMLMHEGGRAWYSDNRAFFPPDFCESLDKHLAEIAQAGLSDLTPSDVSSMFEGRLESPTSDTDE
jgi:hypothetical protein